MQAYLALVPRGLEHVVEEVVRSALLTTSSSSSQDDRQDDPAVVVVQVQLVGEERHPTTSGADAAAHPQEFLRELQDKVAKLHQTSNKRRRQESTIGTCRSTVGAVQVADNQHFSVGYCCCGGDNDNDNGTTSSSSTAAAAAAALRIIGTRAGQLQGTVWMQIRTNAPVETVCNLRCLGPLLALVNVFEQADLGEGQSLEEAIREIERLLGVGGKKHQGEAKTASLKGDDYASRFQAALELWYQHSQQSAWKVSSEQQETFSLPNNMAHLKYRLSCMRTESKKYQYSRHELLASRATDCILPLRFHSSWSVDLTHYDVEVVLLQRSHSLAVGLALRPYQKLQVKSFAAGVLPPDISEPFLAGSFAGLVRLRPTTAHVLLHLARIGVGDVVLDPCAGVGTIPTEASLLQAVGLGGDLVLTDPGLRSVAIEYSHRAGTMRMAQQRRKKAGVADRPCAWDATNLPIRAGVVDAVVSDLPFGQQCMSSFQLDVFLPLLMFEMARVLRPETGRMVLLCGSYVPILEALKSANDRILQDSREAKDHSNVVWELPCTAVFPVNIGGHMAWIIVVVRGKGVALSVPGHAERVKRLTGKRERVARQLKDAQPSKPKRPQA